MPIGNAPYTPRVTVTAAAVNAALASDPAASRTALELGTMAQAATADYTPTASLGSAAFESGFTGPVDPLTSGPLSFQSGVLAV